MKLKSWTTKILILDFLALLLVIGAFAWRYYVDKKDQALYESGNNYYEPEKVAEEPPPAATPSTNTETQKVEIKSEVLLSVPYTRQAPFSVWDALHEDACEEASLLMIKHFVEGSIFDSKQQADDEIKAMVAYEEKSGYGLSITLDQLNNIAAADFGMKTGRVEKNITTDDIKRELSLGKPVIIGAAGKLLPNPYFKNGGPIYHMLVIKGYDSKDFITNDPGTREGEGFRYSFDAISKAMHDWNNGADILQGGKNYLVFD